MGFYGEIKCRSIRTAGMVTRIFCTTLFVFFIVSNGIAQQYLFGRILKKGSQEIIPGVSVHNFSTKKYNTSDLGGNYRIAASAGDTIVFTSAGYLADTLYLTGAAPAGGFNMLLVPNIVALPGVLVDEMSKYEADSMERKKDYSFIFDRKHPVKLMNEKRPGDAPGLNFSPIGFFSNREKQKRKLKKQVIAEDQEEYIDAKFPRTRVAFLTKLSGDSLQQFMLRYRPSYAFCRKADYQDMLFYINQKIILFRQGKDKKK